MALIIYVVIVGMYIWNTNRDVMPRPAFYALMICGLMLVWYRFIPPFELNRTMYTQRLHELLPLISVTAILFPAILQIGDDTKQVTIISGWFGLMASAVCLVVFKLFIW